MTDSTARVTRRGDRRRWIEGCGLGNPDAGLFRHKPTGETFGGCSDGLPIYRLTLRKGSMIYMGEIDQPAADWFDHPDSVLFYRLPGGRYLRLVIPYFYGVYGECCSLIDELPELEGTRVAFPEPPRAVRRRRVAARVSARADRDIPPGTLPGTVERVGEGAA